MVVVVSSGSSVLVAVGMVVVAMVGSSTSCSCREW